MFLGMVRERGWERLRKMGRMGVGILQGIR
jgi:hypothetical protein